MNAQEYAKKEIERFTKVNSLNNATERELLEKMFELAWHDGFTRGVQTVGDLFKAPPALPLATMRPFPSITADCGCPPLNVCMNVACPRRAGITSVSLSGSSDNG
jgi:hypothetical protein